MASALKGLVAKLGLVLILKPDFNSLNELDRLDRLNGLSELDEMPKKK